MSADILERLEARLALRAEPPEWANPPVYVDSTECRAVLREAAAEIGRLRGEVKKLAAAVPVPRDPKAHQWNGDGERCLVCGDKDWMGGPCSGAMPSGVEASREQFNAWMKTRGVISSWHVQQDMWNAWTASRAADNRDAAGVAHAPGFTFGVGGIAVSTGKYREEPAVFLRGVPERGVVGKPVEGTDLKAVMVFPTVEQMQRVADALVNAPAPAAVPAGEAVTWLASDGEVFTDKESADRHSKVWGVNPLLTPLYTTPPAPVQAAPQEGEAMDRGPWRRKGARFYSDDFTHDVSLVVGGDFGSDEVEDRYLDWLLSVLNGPAGAALQHRGDSQEVGRG